MAIFFHFFVHKACFCIKICSVLNLCFDFVSFFPQFLSKQCHIPLLEITLQPEAGDLQMVVVNARLARLPAERPVPTMRQVRGLEDLLAPPVVNLEDHRLDDLASNVQDVVLPVAIGGEGVRHEDVRLLANHVTDEDEHY